MYMTKGGLGSQRARQESHHPNPDKVTHRPPTKQPGEGRLWSGGHLF